MVPTIVLKNAFTVIWFFDDVIAVEKSMIVIGGSYWQGVWLWKTPSQILLLTGFRTSPGGRSSELLICHLSKDLWNTSAKMYVTDVFWSFYCGNETFFCICYLCIEHNWQTPKNHSLTGFFLYVLRIFKKFSLNATSDGLPCCSQCHMPRTLILTISCRNYYYERLEYFLTQIIIFIYLIVFLNTVECLEEDLRFYNSPHWTAGVPVEREPESTGGAYCPEVPAAWQGIRMVVREGCSRKQALIRLTGMT